MSKLNKRVAEVNNNFGIDTFMRCEISSPLHLHPSRIHVHEALVRAGAFVESQAAEERLELRVFGKRVDQIIHHLHVALVDQAVAVQVVHLAVVIRVNENVRGIAVYVAAVGRVFDGRVVIRRAIAADETERVDLITFGLHSLQNKFQREQQTLVQHHEFRICAFLLAQKLFELKMWGEKNILVGRCDFDKAGGICVSLLPAQRLVRISADAIAVQVFIFDFRERNHNEHVEACALCR